MRFVGGSPTSPSSWTAHLAIPSTFSERKRTPTTGVRINIRPFMSAALASGGPVDTSFTTLNDARACTLAAGQARRHAPGARSLVAAHAAPMRKRS